MQIKNSTVLIKGANRGIGLAFAKALLAGGARKVYAGAPDPAKTSLAGITKLASLLTDEMTRLVKHSLSTEQPAHIEAH